MKINWLVGKKRTLGHNSSCRCSRSHTQIENININVIYLLLVYTLAYTHFDKFWTLFLAQFSTWSKWRQRRWWLKVKKKRWNHVHGKDATERQTQPKNDPTIKRTEEEEENEWMSGSEFMHHEISTHFYVNTKFHLKTRLFSLVITCAIHRGRLIPLFLFRRDKNRSDEKTQGKCVDSPYLQNFHLHSPRVCVCLCCRVLWTYFGMPWVCVSVTNLR